MKKLFYQLNIMIKSIYFSLHATKKRKMFFHYLQHKICGRSQFDQPGTRTWSQTFLAYFWCKLEVRSFPKQYNTKLIFIIILDVNPEIKKLTYFIKILSREMLKN